ncbi:MAG: methionyl-tRNA formyltransferase [Betaproteobacteria bacterium]
MNVGFAGTPPFAATVLAHLLEAGLDVTLVLTRPDRPRGRGLQQTPSAVKALALERDIAVAQPASLAGDAARQRLEAAGIEVLVVAAYGLLLPLGILDIPPRGCINVHASLLPRWRGAAPIQRAILAGDAETGATIMRMDAGLDTGPMLDAVRVPIGARDTAGTLEATLAASGARALVSVLYRLAADEAIAGVAQPATGATYAPKIDKAEATIDWNAGAATIDRQVRAFDPAPGASTSLKGQLIKVWRVEPAAVPAHALPGTILEASGEGIVVACGEGLVRIAELQPAGGRRMPAAAFLAARASLAGTRFEAGPA